MKKWYCQKHESHYTNIKADNGKLVNMQISKDHRSLTTISFEKSIAGIMFDWLPNHPMRVGIEKEKKMENFLQLSMRIIWFVLNQFYKMQSFYALDLINNFF